MKFQSVNKLFQESFVKHWDRPAVSDFHGETFSYEDVANHIAQLHLFFDELGVEKHERIAICGQNQAGWAISFLATLTYGAVPVPILHDFTADNIRNLLGHSEARVFFADHNIWKVLNGEVPSSVTTVINLKTNRLFYAANPEIEQALDKAEHVYKERYPVGIRRDDLNYFEDSADDMAVLNYTSGTSGFSKGVMIPYRALYSNLEFGRLDAKTGLDSTKSVVSMLPMAHMYGMMFEFLFEISIGAHVIFLTKAPSPKIILGAFAQVQPDLIVTVPLVIEKIYKSKIKDLIKKVNVLLKVPVVDNIIKDKIRQKLVNTFGGKFEEIIMGGAAFNPEAEKFFHDIKFPYTVGYGMTECAPIITYAHHKEAKLYSCGKLVRNMELRIISADPHNIPGEVQVRGANVFLGYYKNPEATAEAFTEDGWFRTGDIGILDEDGYLFLRGRSKCMILGPSGQNIYPEEIEYSINNLPYVVDSLVIDDNGTLCALIFPDYAAAEKDGMDAAAVKEKIASFLPALNKQLPSYSKIKKIECRDEDFERTPKKSIRRYLYQKS